MIKFTEEERTIETIKIEYEKPLKYTDEDYLQEAAMVGFLLYSGVCSNSSRMFFDRLGIVKSIEIINKLGILAGTFRELCGVE